MNNGVMIIYGVMIKYFISFDFLDKINAALMSIKDAFQKYYKILNIININCFNIHWPEPCQETLKSARLDWSRASIGHQ